MKMSMGLAAILLSTCAVGAPEVLVPADAKLEKVFDGGCVILEGVTAAPDGTIFFSDVTVTSLCHDPTGIYPAAGNIWRLDPATGRATIFRSPSGMSNGLKFDAAGNLVAAEGADHGGRRITRTDMSTGRSYILTALFEGRPYNSPNDLAIDARGRIYFTDPRYEGYEPLEQLIEAVYRIDPDGRVTRLLTGARKPNGIAISPDQKTLYVIDSDSGSYRLTDRETESRSRLFAYDLMSDGSIARERLLIDWHSQSAADGMCVDAEGNLYIAVHETGRQGVRIYSPQGQEIGYISTGETPAQNVGFGRGRESHVLYIAAGRSVFRIRVRNAG